MIERKSTKPDGYTNIAVRKEIRNALHDAATRHNVSIAALVECLLHIDDKLLAEFIDTTKKARKDTKALAKELRGLSSEEINQLLTQVRK